MVQIPSAQTTATDLMGQASGFWRKGLFARQKYALCKNFG